MFRTLLVGLLLVSSAHAATPIGEFHFTLAERSLICNHGPACGPTYLDFRFSLAGSANASDIGQWQRSVTAVDVGQTFPVTGQELADMAAAWTSPNRFVSVSIAASEFELGNVYFSAVASLPISIGANSFTFTPMVADIAAHPLGSVAITVDAYHAAYVDPKGMWSGAFTARLYSVPEPSACLILLSAIHGLYWRRR